MNSSSCSAEVLDDAEAREHADRQRADAEEDDEEAAGRGEFSHDQRQTAGKPQPPVPYARDYMRIRLRSVQAVQWPASKIEGFMPLILVTNDDGVTSEGIHALADAMRPLGDVLVVAPLQEASAIGHALTLRRPLTNRIDQRRRLRRRRHADRLRQPGVRDPAERTSCRISSCPASTRDGTSATTSLTRAPCPAPSKARCSGRRASPSP